MKSLFTNHQLVKQTNIIRDENLQLSKKTDINHCSFSNEKNLSLNFFNNSNDYEINIFNKNMKCSQTNSKISPIISLIYSDKNKSNSNRDDTIDSINYLQNEIIRKKLSIAFKGFFNIENRRELKETKNSEDYQNSIPLFQKNKLHKFNLKQNFISESNLFPKNLQVKKFVNHIFFEPGINLKNKFPSKNSSEKTLSIDLKNLKNNSFQTQIREEDENWLFNVHSNIGKCNLFVPFDRSQSIDRLNKHQTYENIKIDKLAKAKYSNTNYDNKNTKSDESLQTSIMKIKRNSFFISKRILKRWNQESKLNTNSFYLYNSVENLIRKNHKIASWRKSLNYYVS